MFKRISISFISLILCLTLCCCSASSTGIFKPSKNDDSNKTTENADKNSDNDENVEKYVEPIKSKYTITNNSIQEFDLSFLKLENNGKNMVYSPLSIKYALKMLEEGSMGLTKAEIAGVIGDYNVKSYPNSKNMSFANAMFINSAFKKSINDKYTKTLSDKFNAYIVTDPFKTPNTINAWVKNKTLGLIDNLFDDVSQYNFLLVNALAIDMEWKGKFLDNPQPLVAYDHEDFYWSGGIDIVPSSFNGVSKEVSGMEITASYNGYDIVKVLGEEHIRKTVTDAYLEYIEEYDLEFGDELFWDDIPEGLTNDEIMDLYLDNYIKEINGNYKAFHKITDYSFYVNNNVKVFAKDLKKYNGVTLQYVGIMPTKDNLESYINKTTAKDINKLIGSLKELKPSSFKNGVVTKITGYIPKFKFDYDLNLKRDLKKLGINEVFKQGKANLSNLTTDKSLFIGDASHKANIEFTQDGIKASAATYVGGIGAPAIFDYEFNVPVEEIDLTFNKPYMFLIRDKSSGEIWFVGTVYNPLLYSNDKTTGDHYEW